MGDFASTVTIKPASSSAKKKAAKAGRKTKGGPRKIHIAGKITNNPKRTQALVKELKRLAAKYKFKVRER